MSSRGTAVSAYIPAFSKGAKVYGANIQSGTITSAHIANGTIVAADVAAGSITSAKLGAAAVVATKVRYAAVTATVANSGVVYALAHGLGATPSIVLFEPLGTVGQLKGAATSAGLVGKAIVSANTSTNIYYAGSKNARFTAYCIV